MKKKKTNKEPETTPESAEPKLRQSEIPGTERPRIEVLDRAMDDYNAKKHKRILALQDEVAAKRLLVDLMHKYSDGEEPKLPKNSNGEIVYRNEEHIAVLAPKGESLKVKTCEEDEVAIGETDGEGDGE